MFRERFSSKRRKRRQAVARLSRKARFRRPPFELLEARMLLAHNISIATGGLTSIPAGAATFADTADYTIDPVALNSPGSVALRANTDIRFQSPVTKSTSDALLAEAGRSIVVTANITTAA